MPRDAAGRHDSSVQRAARYNRSEKYRCPTCSRANALLWRYDTNHERILECRWRDRGLCDYVRRFNGTKEG